MKIGMVCYPTMGGSGIVATRLGMQLAKQGHDVHFVTYEPPFELDLSQRGVFFHPVKITQYELFKYPDYALALAVKLAQVAREASLDLFHVHYAIPHATSAWLSRQLLGGKGPAIVTTLHGTDISLIGRDRSFFDLVRHSVANSDAVTAVSDYLRRQTETVFSIQRPIEVIPNFAASPTESKRCPRPEFLPRDCKVIMHVSNFRPVKRIPDVLATFALICKQIRARLMLIGNGSGLEPAQAMARHLGLEQDILFLGVQHNVEQLLAHADLFLLPSEQESFGLAALEAMAQGVPIVASNAGGLPEIITDGEQGYLLPVGDVEGMAAQALKLLRNPAQHAAFSRAASQRAHSDFRPDRIVDQYEQCYRKLCTESQS